MTGARVIQFIVCGDQSPPSTTALGFVERFKSLPQGQRHEAPKTGTVGTVVAEDIDGVRPLDDGTQRDQRADGGRHIAYPQAAAPPRGRNPIVNRRGQLLVTR